MSPQLLLRALRKCEKYRGYSLSILHKEPVTRIKQMAKFERVADKIEARLLRMIEKGQVATIREKERWEHMKNLIGTERLYVR